MSITSRSVLSLAFMQVGWLACVLGAARGHGWLGPLVISVGLAIHLRAQPRAARAKEAGVLVVAAVVGFLVDSALLRAGVITVAGAALSPPWLVALWPNLAAATARGGSLGSLDRRPALGALLGAVGGPLAYDEGARLGALGLGQSRLGALASLGATWSLVLPTVFWLRHRVGAPPGSGRRDETRRRAV
jgi:hypothetical protein